MQGRDERREVEVCHREYSGLAIKAIEGFTYCDETLAVRED